MYNFHKLLSDAAIACYAMEIHPAEQLANS